MAYLVEHKYTGDNVKMWKRNEDKEQARILENGRMKRVRERARDLNQISEYDRILNRQILLVLCII